MATRIVPISEVKRHLATCIAELGEQGGALYVTQHGRPAAVLLTFADYEALLQRMEDLEDLSAMKGALAAPEEEAIGLEEYERRRATAIRS